MDHSVILMMLGAVRKASDRRGKDSSSEELLGFVSANDLLCVFGLST